MRSRRAPAAAALAAAALSLALALALASGGVRADDARQAPLARNLILLIGDGMGLAQVGIGRLVNGGALALDGMPVTGLAITSSADSAVTESAAAGTALACGVKTKNRVVGMDEKGEAVRSILEAARAGGRAAGVVTTTRVTHATPACFLAHQRDREDEEAIAGQLVESRAEVILGGGSRLFEGALGERAKARGYEMATTREELGKAGGERVLGLFAPGHLPYEVDRNRDLEPSLADLTAAAIVRLSAREAGFVLMVEGGRIDHAAHEHDAATVASEMVAFDAAIDVALKFAAARKDTLVVVTADHATGGMAISELVDVAGLKRFKASAERMTDLAQGKGGGLDQVVRHFTGLTLGATEVRSIQGATGEDGPIVGLGHALSSKLGVFFYALDALERMGNTHGHDGTMVGVHAFGPGADRFTGTYQNNEVPRRMAAAAGIEGLGHDPLRKGEH